MGEDVISIIDKRANEITEKDLEWLVPKLIEHYQLKINYLSIRAYSCHDELARKSFTEHSKIEINNALNTYIFKYKHWKTEGRSIHPYLMSCLNRLSSRLKEFASSKKKTNSPVCPACREKGRKEHLQQDGDKLWRCESCYDELNRLSDDSSSEFSSLKMASAFALHSRSGVRCPDCNRFIPESENRGYVITCPYDNCSFFGNIESLDKMSHPISLSFRDELSIDKENSNSQNNDGPGSSLKNVIPADSILGDVVVSVKQQIYNEFHIMNSVIEDQIEQIKRTNSSPTINQKLIMYEAFKLMIKKYPEEMLSYLVHRKNTSEFPIQAKIFQQYADIMENFLPFSIEKNGEIIDIMDLTDPHLSLFEGISEFRAEVDRNLIIPNKTEETYTGGRKFKRYGSYFIGKLIKVSDLNGNCLNDKVVDYNFVSVQMRDVVPWTPVAVKHFRIIPHYEMTSLVFLQRIRRSLVDSIYYRINRTRRETRK